MLRISLVLLLGLTACGPNLEGDDEGECTDDADNDGDGLFDCDDQDCWGSEACASTDAVDDADGDGYSTEQGDCRDDSAAYNPAAADVWGDDIDHNCDGADGIADLPDRDSDGFSTEDGDCDDRNGSINPSATDIVGDGIDQNCDDVDGTDVDGDGQASVQSGGEDCDDSDVGIRGFFNFYEDRDDDGYGDPERILVACDPIVGFVANELDCNDADPWLNPDTPWFADDDDDGFGDAGDVLAQCEEPAGRVADNTDCNDGNSDVNPLAQELPQDNIDQNCDSDDGVKETFHPEGRNKVDVLFLIDDSCSMDSHQQGFGANADAFIDTLLDGGVDMHVGAVTTDMSDPDRTGKMLQVGSGGGRFFTSDNTKTEAQGLFFEMVTPGINGDAYERGRSAIYHALTTERNGANVGFARSDAYLVVAALTDENDYSEDSDITNGDFIDWFTSLRGGNTVYHALASMEGCAFDVSQDYFDVARATGGVQMDICGESRPFLREVAIDALGLGRDFPLAQPAVGATMWVRVTTAGGAVTSYPSSAWTYDADTQSLVFNEYVPPAGSTVEVAYVPAN